VPLDHDLDFVCPVMLHCPLEIDACVSMRYQTPQVIAPLLVRLR
jgi:hypothetical protein